MARPLSGVSPRVILLASFALLHITCEGLPVRDGIPGEEAHVWYDTVFRRFYGPWSSLQKANGEYADYGDYGQNIQNFEPGPEDVPADEPEEAEGEEADFPSNYGEIGVPDLNVTFEASAKDQTDQSSEDQSVGGAEPENHDLEGNVQWTSSAT